MRYPALKGSLCKTSVCNAADSEEYKLHTESKFGLYKRG